MKKLVGLGLVREVGNCFVINRVVVDNIVRIRRVAIPTQVAYVAFFGGALIFLLTLFGR